MSVVTSSLTACMRVGTKKKRRVLILIVLIGTGCNKQKNVCPIDGQPPQWVGQRKGSSCEYFHYNDVERQTHSWWADCAHEGKQ